MEKSFCKKCEYFDHDGDFEDFDKNYCTYWGGGIDDIEECDRRTEREEDE